MVVPGGTVVDRCGRIVSPRGTAVVPSGAGGFPSEQERIYFSYTSVTALRFVLHAQYCYTTESKTMER